MIDILFDNEGLQEEFNIQLAERPVIPVAQAIYDEYPVPGRNGVLKQFNRFDNTIFTLRFNYIDKYAKPKFIEIVNWLQNKRIYQESDNRYYRILAHSIPEISPANNDIAEWCDFEITIETEPFWYENAGITTVTDSLTLINPSNIDSGAVLTIYGTGICKVRINDNVMEFSDVKGKLVVDGILKTKLQRYNQMSGYYPVLKSGENEIEISGDTEKVEIQKRWCWR